MRRYITRGATEGADIWPELLEKLVKLDAKIDQHDEDVRRLERMRFAIAFAAVEKEPKGYARDAHYVGLYFRWMRTVIGWGLGEGHSIEEIADEMGVSVGMVEDYVAAPTSSNDEFIAAVCR
ncbi:hypothetical protein [Mycobacterium sp. URHB0021]